MAKWGSADFQQLLKLQQNIETLRKTDIDAFCAACLKELAARLLGLVIPRTPVYDKYSAGSGKKGGTLRRGWTAKGEKEAAGSSTLNASKYAQTLPIIKKGDTYHVTVYNPVHYASYVEYGHRTAGGASWVPGQYFLTISEQQLEQMTPAILERKLQAKLKEVFNV